MKLALLNTTIITTDGTFECRTVTLEEVKNLISQSDSIISAIGHDSTAQIMSELLSIEVKTNRINFLQDPETIAICFKMNGRPAEGKIMNAQEIEQMGYSFKLITMTK